MITNVIETFICWFSCSDAACNTNASEVCEIKFTYLLTYFSFAFTRKDRIMGFQAPKNYFRKVSGYLYANCQHILTRL